MKKFTSLCIVFLLTIVALHTQAQRLIFERISMAQGISQHSVNAIIQDSTGFLWFATNDGLNKYDGYEFRIFKPIPGNPHSISGNKITALLQDSEGKIWIGLDDGLNIFDTRTETFSQFKNEQGNNRFTHKIFDIFEDSEKNVWIASNGGGLFCFDRKTETFCNFTHNPHDPTSIASNVVRAISQDKYGTIWVGMNAVKALNKFDLKTKKFTTLPFAETDVMSIHCDSYGQLWIGTYNLGFVIINPKTETEIAGDNKRLTSNTVWSFYEDSARQRMYVATRDGGLNIFHTQTHTFLTSYQATQSDFSLSSNLILSVYKDRSGVLWVGTENAGLNKSNTQRKNFKTLRTQNGMALTNVFSIIDDEHNMWIGTRGDGLHSISKATKTIHTFNSVSKKINTMIYDPRGFFWIGTEGDGLLRFNPNTRHVEQFKENPDNANALSNNAIKSLFLDKNNILWIGTYGGGLCKYDYTTKKFTTIPISDNADRNVVWCIAQDNEEIMWIGTKNLGLLRYDPKTNNKQFFTRNLNKEHTISHNEVSDILITGNGDLWVGTSGGGINKFNKVTNSFITFSRKNGLPNDVIASLQEDNHGDIWVATDFGLAKFDPKRMICTNYYKIDGLASNSFNQGARYKNSQGELFFGGNTGVSRFLPDSISNTLDFGNVVLTDLKIFNQSITVGEEIDDRVILEKALRFLDHIELSYKESFSIEFANLDFVAPEKIQYKYRLDGFDKDSVWQYTDANKRFATYTNLPGRTYTFEVMATNSDGVWSNQCARLTITIIPPFWRTTWFYSLIIIMLIFGVYGFVKIRERNFLDEKEKLEQMVNERTKEIEERRKEIEVQKDLLSQKHAELLNSNKQIQDSINYAKRIQEVILPRASEIEKYLPNSFVFFKPRDVVSGDFYWISKQNDDLYVAVADSTGHGVPGAFMSLIGSTLLNEITHNARNQHPVAILEKMNKGIMKALKQKRGDQIESQDDSVDITLCKINKVERTVQIASAQQSYFYIAPNSEIEIIHGDMTSIGGSFNTDIEFTNREFEYQPGASFYFFSDGFSDQFGGAENKKYQTARLKNLILDIQNLPMNKQYAMVEMEFDTWKHDNRQT
ncbi:MAG: SpoIIE family protein phosphatase, partial [Bacteroidales bacterium]|nr:SpoIIE family protein phosphatase [Bacteroidales bacterium]